MELLSKTGIPFAYDHFAEGESPDQLFICFLLPTIDNFSADGQVYFKVTKSHICLSACYAASSKIRFCVLK